MATASTGPGFQQFQLSKVSEVLGIRKNTHYHGVDVITQVASISPPHPAYKYFNCYVVDDGDEESRKKFSFKVDTQFFQQVIALNVGDIIRIRKAIRYNAKRTSSGYVKRPEDLELQLNAWEETGVDILCSVTHQEIVNFAILTMPFKNITLRGVVDTLPEEHGGKWVFMLNDPGAYGVEIQSEKAIDIKVGDECVVQGDSVKHSGIVYILAKEVVPFKQSRIMESNPTLTTTAADATTAVPSSFSTAPSVCHPPVSMQQIAIPPAPLSPQVAGPSLPMLPQIAVPAVAMPLQNLGRSLQMPPLQMPPQIVGPPVTMLPQAPAKKPTQKKK